jgi:hypothetical protein
MIPESLTVLQLQVLRNRLADSLDRLLRDFVRETGVIVHVEKCHAQPRFDDGSIQVDVSVYCGLSDGLETIP